MTQEFIDQGICEAIHNALKDTKDDFFKENGEKAKANLVKLTSGEKAFQKLA